MQNFNPKIIFKSTRSFFLNFSLKRKFSFEAKIKKMKDSSSSSFSLKFPIGLILASLGIYEGWRYLPYGTMVSHFTISENINQNNYFHAIFLAPLSFQTTGHMVLYFPLMCAGLLLNSKILNSRKILLLYLSNSVLCTGSTYYYEKKYKNQKMIVPKCIGACTSLSQIFCFLALQPNFLFANNKMLPFFMIPAIAAMYEYNEFKNGYVNEISRPSHFVSMGFGFSMGLIFKKFI